MVTDWQIFFSRLLFAFVNIGVGTSFLLQNPNVPPPPREFLSSLPLPFEVYGAVLTVVGVLIVVASVQQSAYWIFRLFQSVAVLWALLSIGYLEPVFTDPLHVLWTGFVLYFFVGAVHQAAALIEVHRV